MAGVQHLAVPDGLERRSQWLFRVPLSRRRIPVRLRAPRTGPLPGRRIERWSCRSPIRSCGCRSSGMPAARRAGSIRRLVSGERGDREGPSRGGRGDRRLHNVPGARPVPHAVPFGTGISASTACGVAWSPPSARPCAACCTQTQQTQPATPRPYPRQPAASLLVVNPISGLISTPPAGNYGLYPPLTRTPGHGSGLGSTATVHWSRPDRIHVRSMFARMSQYGPVAAGTRRQRILKAAAQSGTSWRGPVLADTD